MGGVLGIIFIFGSVRKHPNIVDTLRTDDPDWAEFTPEEPFEAELQIPTSNLCKLQAHTNESSIWSNTSHTLQLPAYE